MRRQGRGTFVVDSSEKADTGRFSSLIFDGRRLSLEVTGFHAAVGPMPRHVAAALKAPVSAPAIILDMTWRAGQTARGVERIVTVEASFQGLEGVAAPAAPTLFHVYRRDYHVVVHRVVERVNVEEADEAAARALGVVGGAPILLVTRVAKTRTGDAVEWSERRIALGAAQYEATLG